MRVLCVVAHPDDEVLGCGGTLAKHARAGDRIEIEIIARGAEARGKSREAIEALYRSAMKAARLINAGTRGSYLPDQRLDTLPILEITQIVEAALASFGPDIVYTHYPHDINADHRVVAEAVLTACRPIEGRPHPKRLLFFEVPGSTEWAYPQVFAPNMYVEIDAKAYRTKRRALECYRQEMRAFPHPRSFAAIEARMKRRGSEVGVEMAEAFVLHRDII